MLILKGKKINGANFVFLFFVTKGKKGDKFKSISINNRKKMKCRSKLSVSKARYISFLTKECLSLVSPFSNMTSMPLFHLWSDGNQHRFHTHSEPKRTSALCSNRKNCLLSLSFQITKWNVQPTSIFRIDVNVCKEVAEFCFISPCCYFKCSLSFLHFIFWSAWNLSLSFN